MRDLVREYGRLWCVGVVLIVIGLLVVATAVVIDSSQCGVIGTVVLVVGGLTGCAGLVNETLESSP